MMFRTNSVGRTGIARDGGRDLGPSWRRIGHPPDGQSRLSMRGPLEL